MANHITKLQNQNKAQAREIAALRVGLTEFLAHIEKPKFPGANCEWISANDVRARIRLIESEAFEAFWTPDATEALPDRKPKGRIISAIRRSALKLAAVGS